MFERFTDRARRVVVLSQEEARLLNHDYIGTEHLLLGLVAEREGVAARALTAVGISLEAVRRQVEEIIGQGTSVPSGHIPFTPRAKKVLELSLREALQLGHNYIGTEHILLGLIREGEGVAAQVLVTLGADLARVRQQVVQILSGGAAESVPLVPWVTGPTGPGAGGPAAGRLAARAAGAGGPGDEMFQRSLDRIVFRRFTVSASRVMLLAEAEALRLGHATVGVEHLLLGLLAEEEGAAARALGAVGVDLGRARATAEGTLGRGTATSGDLAYRDDVLDAVERALAEALAAGSDEAAGPEEIDTEHLLLGLVRQAERNQGLTAQAFEALGTSAAAVRAAVADLAATTDDPATSRPDEPGPDPGLAES
jgi:ATP-dependent Clp protease ATP-binding subunit ClpA